MNPAFSIVFFTTLAGVAQGLIVALSIARLAGVPLGAGFVPAGLLLAVLLLLAALGSSFLHLGHKLRAWRAILMWRTSWMSREVIVLPAFLGWVGIWWLAELLQVLPVKVIGVLALGAIALSALLWLCTAMIYASLRFVQEWAHPLTTANYVLIGLSSGLVLTGALAVLGGERALRPGRWLRRCPHGPAARSRCGAMPA